MREQVPPSAQQTSQLIQEYLREHPEIGGLKGLALKTGLSYHSLQKYAKGSNLPPLRKWERLYAVIGLASMDFSTKARLFDDAEENKTMKPDRPAETNQSDEAVPDLTKSLRRSKRTDVEPGESDATLTVTVEDFAIEKEGWSRAEDRQETFLPVHGFVWFYPEEIEIINHPSFQRLAGMHQLGMTNLVYRGATHRRIEHALGAVGVAQRMLDAVEHNCKKRCTPGPKDQWLLGCPPTEFERRFVRLAALLHDIGHVPYGHTIEDELHLLNQHDGERRLSKIFNKDIWYNKRTPTLAEKINEQYRQFIPERLSEQYEAADLLKNLICKPPKEQSPEEKAQQATMEGLFAEAELRIGICRDIVGDTICADLLDYLHRDWHHIGKPRYFDERILHYMEIRTPKSNISISVNGMPEPTADDKFVISIGNRPKLRTDGISGILNLLESRYELAEAVLFHRTKMNATAMLERALGLVIPSSSETDANESLEEWMLSNSEEVLLPAILEGKVKGLVESNKLTGEAKENWQRSCDLVSRLLRRDLYRLLLMETYDEFDGVDVENIQKMYGDDYDAPQNRAAALRRLEKDFGLKPGTIVMYCPESRMNKKIAEVQIFVETNVSRFVDYEDNHENELSAGHLAAQLNRFKRLWKIGFFIDPEVADEKGDEFLSQLRDAIRYQVLNDYPRSESVETLIARIARNVVLIPTFHLFGGKALPSPSPVTFARTDASAVTEQYPTGARSLLDFIQRDGQRNDSADVK
jgi:HD superfamily phosphohydrolase